MAAVPKNIRGFAELNKVVADYTAAKNKYDSTGQLDPNTKYGFQTPGGPNESYETRMDRDVLARGSEFSRAPAQPLPSWAGGQPPSQTPRTPYAPQQLALGAPMGKVAPVQVTNQALSNALRAPPAPQAVGGNNG